jgi:post-segregation antitoxin (ccd killing protein)
MNVDVDAVKESHKVYISVYVDREARDFAKEFGINVSGFLSSKLLELKRTVVKENAKNIVEEEEEFYVVY